jgi:choline monooxygenase
VQLDFDANLATAETLPAALYVDPNVLEMAEERIFARTWQLIAHAGDLARVGDFLPTTIIDEPILLTRPEEQQLCAFFNVCRHRAAQVGTSRGNRESLRCGYHGWVYGLDGQLHTAREMEATENFDKADFGLRPVRVDSLGSFVFANLDQGAAPLAEWIGQIPDEIDAAGCDLTRMRRIERREYQIECNWKVYVDNYLEGYHLPIAHPGLYRELDYDNTESTPSGTTRASTPRFEN